MRTQRSWRTDEFKNERSTGIFSVQNRTAFFSFVLSIALFTMTAWSSDRQSLGQHVPEGVKNLVPIARLVSTNRLSLAIGLPLRNRDALNTLLQQIYDPASSQYRHYLTPEQFTQQFGPTEQDYSDVAAFARKNGLTVTDTTPNRTLLVVNGSVADIEKTFHVKMQVYQHPSENRTFYAPDVEPTIDATIPVLHINGLDNYQMPHPKNLTRSPADQANGVISKAGSGPSGNYIGKDFRAAYAPGVSLDGSGQVVGLIEFGGYYASDITAYETKAGLLKVALTNVLANGVSGTPGPDTSEQSLDIELAIAMAPGLSQVIVYEGSLSPSSDTPTLNNVVLNLMATDNKAKQLSCSWDMHTDANTEQIFLQFAAQGQSFFDASGDKGAYTNAIPTPDDDPYITIVGGTTLTMTGSGGSWASEKTWNANTIPVSASGGGISLTYSIPSWQQGISMVANQGSTTMRNIPDVAMTADNVYVIANNGQKLLGEGGTSCAAPLWAGFTALINQQAAANGLPPVGFINPSVYAICKGTNYASCFHDITTGNNTNRASNSKFSAVAGYDLCTGWGTPTGQNLINALAPQPYTFTTNNGGITITSYTGAGGAVTIPGTINGLSVTGVGSNAFYDCQGLTSIMIPNSVTNIGNSAFGSCTNLAGVYFKGNSPGIGSSVFAGDNNPIIYYLPATANWGTTFGGCQTSLWRPQISGDAGFGAQANQFGFTIVWGGGVTTVVETCTNLIKGNWSPVETNILANGTSYFSDPDWTNYPCHFYRIKGL